MEELKCAPPDSLAASGSTSKGGERDKRKEKRDGKEGERIPPKVKVNRINTG